MGGPVWEDHLQMHDQSDWLIEWIFRSPTHDEFLQVVIQVFLMEWRRIDGVEELVEVAKVYLDGIFASRR